MQRLCGARLKHGRPGRCRKWALRGRLRCQLHAGASTGPRTPQGMQRTVAALVAGRHAWLARLKEAGLPTPYANRVRRTWGAPPKTKPVARGLRVLKDVAMAIEQNRALPVPAPDATGEAYFEAGGMAVEVAKAMLAPQIDLKQVVDPEW